MRAHDEIAMWDLLLNQVHPYTHELGVITDAEQASLLARAARAATPGMREGLLSFHLPHRASAPCSAQVMEVTQ